MSCYVHDLPGRLRVRIPAPKGNAITTEKLVNQVRALEGISSVTANPVAGSLLIRYDPTITSAEACLAILNIHANRQPDTSMRISHTVANRTRGGASKLAEAAIWYLLEKTVERLVLAVLC